jgi:thiol-disulfide isomerase/thioredoxin
MSLTKLCNTLFVSAAISLASVGCAGNSIYLNFDDEPTQKSIEQSVVLPNVEEKKDCANGACKIEPFTYKTEIKVVPELPTEPGRTIAITKDNIDIIYKGNVVIDVWAPWCGPCLHFAPEYEQISKKYADSGITFAKMNYDENKQIINQLVEQHIFFAKVKAIPQLIYMKNGKEIDRSSCVYLETVIDVHFKK